jgi:hypothetical protein
MLVLVLVVISLQINDMKRRRVTNTQTIGGRDMREHEGSSPLPLPRLPVLVMVVDAMANWQTGGVWSWTERGTGRPADRLCEFFEDHRPTNNNHTKYLRYPR